MSAWRSTPPDGGAASGRGFFRIGSEAYAEMSSSFGLATIHKRHVKIEGRTLAFDYSAKGGHRVLSLVDPEVLEAIRLLKARRRGGPELLAYKSARVWHDVKSGGVNAYVREGLGGEFTAKDFRTWQATVLAAAALGAAGPGESKDGGKARGVPRGPTDRRVPREHSSGRVPRFLHRPTGGGTLRGRTNLSLRHAGPRARGSAGRGTARRGRRSGPAPAGPW